MSFHVVPPQGSVHRLYLSIIDEVTDNIRDLFLDEGLDESQLNEFAHLWQLKLDASKAVDIPGNNESDDGGTNIQSALTSSMLRRYPSSMPRHHVPCNDSSANRLAYQTVQPNRKMNKTSYEQLQQLSRRGEPIDFSTSTHRQYPINIKSKPNSLNESIVTGSHGHNLMHHLQSSRPTVTTTGFAPFGSSLGCVPFDHHLMQNAMLNTTSPALNNSLASYLAMRQGQARNSNTGGIQTKSGLPNLMKTESRMQQDRQMHSRRNISPLNRNNPQHSSLIASKLLSQQRKLQHQPDGEPPDGNFDADLLIRALSNNNFARESGKSNISGESKQHSLRINDSPSVINALRHGSHFGRNLPDCQSSTDHLLISRQQMQHRGSKRKQPPIPFEEDLLIRGQRPAGPTPGGNMMMRPQQFDGAEDDTDSLESENQVTVHSGTEYVSEEDDDDLDQFAAAIYPELSDTNEAVVEDSDPLNSGDDVSEEDPVQLFDSDNIIVCQFDKINRSKARWKFLLKEGIMNIRGKDYVFSRAQGEADW